MVLSTRDPGHLGGAVDDAEIEFCAEFEAFRSIKSDGGLVGGVSMDIRHAACFRYPPYHESGQRSCQSLPLKVGVGAYAADLGETGLAHPHSGHRSDLSANLEAEEVPQLLCAKRERTGFGQFGECQHLFRIGRSEPFNTIIIMEGIRLPGEEHLHQHRGLNIERAFGQSKRLDLDHCQHFTGLHQSEQRGHTFGAVVPRCAEGDNARRIASGQIAAFCKGSMPRGEG